MEQNTVEFRMGAKLPVWVQFKNESVMTWIRGHVLWKAKVSLLGSIQGTLLFAKPGVIPNDVPISARSTSMIRTTPTSLTFGSRTSWLLGSRAASSLASLRARASCASARPPGTAAPYHPKSGPPPYNHDY